MNTQKAVIKVRQYQTKTPIQTIRKAYDSLRKAVDYGSMYNHADRLFAMCKAEEKDHRGFIPNTFNQYHPGAPSVADIGRLFAVKRVAEYLLGDRFPQGQDYLHYQKSCFQAAGIADEYKDKIDAQWSADGINVREMADLDYTQYVRTLAA